MKADRQKAGDLAALRRAQHDFDPTVVQTALSVLLTEDAVFRLAHPLGEGLGADALYDRAYRALFAAWPDLERRDTIVIAGQDADGADWVGCCGYYTGTFAHPWLDIPPTGHQVAMRFHEFYRVERGKVAEIQAIWDIPEVMMQAGAWPMGPSLGRDWQVPGPATQDGLGPHGRDAVDRGRAACRHVTGMLEHMVRHPSQGGPEVMQMDRFWHPRMNWYGPAGIGTARGIAGFRNWHQIPFLNAMPDRGQRQDGIDVHLFGEGDYVGVTGWPNMRQTLSHPGWLGLPPTGQQITLRSLDFWRLENGLIRENWVLVDLLDVYAQLRVDVLGRMREFNKARAGFDPETGRAQ
jgi:predicted ester cyclase